jgi:hypothetical protein
VSLRPILHQGVAVSIGHLAPFAFPCPCDPIGRDLVIQAAFSNHCYTEKFNPSVHSREQIVLYEGGRSRPRVFCQIRHELSFQLPDLLRALPGRKVHQTPEQRNYVYVVPLPVGDQTYDIFFMLQRMAHGDGADLRLTVESAYPKGRPLVLPKRPHGIRFGVLAHKVFMRQPVRFAPR